MKSTFTLSLHNVQFNFDGQPIFFDNLSCQFTSGNMYFLQGDNGTGKSTLFNIIRGQTNQEDHLSGTITLNAHSVPLIPHHTLSQAISAVPQAVNTALIDDCTVIDNLQFASLPTYPSLRSLSTITQLPPLLTTAHIQPDQLVRDLSGGQKQLLAISMMLIKQPTVLLLDEPTAALDKANAHAFMKELTHLTSQKNLIVIMICHDQELIKNYAQPHNQLILERTDQGPRTLHAHK